MSRLPTPGQDSGTWGSILNDYLSQSLNSNGTLKDNIVDTSQIKDGAIVSSKLDTTTQLALAKAENAVQTSDIAGLYSKPSNGIPLSDLKKSDLDNTYTATDTNTYNVLDHGVVPNSNADMSTAVQSLIDTLTAQTTGPSGQGKGAIIFFPPGTYKLNVILATGVKIKGVGLGTVWRPYTNGPVFSAPSTNLSYSGILDGYIYGNDIPISSVSGSYTEGGFNDGIYLPMGTGSSSGPTSGTWECEFRNLRIEHCGNHGLHIEGGTIYQAQQFSLFENIHCEYNLGSGIWQYGFVQNNLFTRVTLRQNKGDNLHDKAYLSGVNWNTSNNNTYFRCIFEGSGTYLEGSALTKVTDTTHGVYSEGSSNVYDSCWWEGNGLGESIGGAHASSGIYLNFIPTGNAFNRIINSHFDNHYMDVYCVEGGRNQFWNNEYQWDGTAPAAKFSYFRVGRTSAEPVIGPTNCNYATQFMYKNGGSTTTAYLTEQGGKWGIGVAPNALVNGAGLTLEGGHLAFKTNDAYDIGIAGNAPRDLYATRNLQLAGIPLTYGTAAPTSGTFIAGAIILNAAPTPDSPLGWRCISGGSPGTWTALLTTSGSWQSMLLINGWASVAGSATASYRLSMDGSHVELAGQISSGTQGTVAFVLPAGFRPITQKVLTAANNISGGAGRLLTIATDGQITVGSAGGTAPPFSLDGLSFPLDI